MKMTKAMFQEFKADYDKAMTTMSYPAQVLFLQKMTTSITALVKDQIKAEVKAEVKAELARGGS